MNLSMKPLSAADIQSKENNSRESFSFFDFSKILVCQVDFIPKRDFEDRLKLENMTLSSVFRRD